MNLFRSEEHIDAWSAGDRGGASTSIELLCALAHAWFFRLDPGWRPRSRAQSQAILDRLGLMDPFWTLPG
ncbi:MAG: hypothetical protein ACR2HR_00345 [Euzebya sp.]